MTTACPLVGSHCLVLHRALEGAHGAHVILSTAIRIHEVPGALQVPVQRWEEGFTGGLESCALSVGLWGMILKVKIVSDCGWRLGGGGFNYAPLPLV